MRFSIRKSASGKWVVTALHMGVDGVNGMLWGTFQTWADALAYVQRIA